VLLASSRLIKEDPAAIKAFMQGIFEANELLSHKPEEAARMLPKLTGLSLEEQLGVVGRPGGTTRASGPCWSSPAAS
jgi:taurine transport system substrate-binding protein